MLSKANLLKQFKKHKQRDTANLAAQHNESRENHQFVAGDSMYYTANVNDKGQRRAVVFNKISPYVDAVLGTMIQMRRKPDYQARLEDSEQQKEYSRVSNNFSDYCRDNANLDFIETLQDREMLICGYGAVDTNVGYEKNPDGEIVAEVIRFDDIFWDNMAKDPNLLDARWVRRRKAFSREDVISRWGEEKLPKFESYRDGTESDKEYNPNGGEYTATAFGDDDQHNDLYQIHYYQWWELKPYYRAKNPIKDIEDPAIQDEFISIMQKMSSLRSDLSTDEEREDLFSFNATDDYLSMTPVQHQDMVKLTEEYGLPFKAIRQHKRCYYTALITGDIVLDQFKSPDQDGFTIKFKTAKYDPVQRLWYGMVRALKNPQEYANKALTEMLLVIAKNSKGGVMYEEDAVDDVRKFEQQYSRTDSAVRVNSGAISGNKIAPKAQAALPTGYEHIHNIADSSMSDVSGISKEYLGTATNKQVSALLENQRINQVLSTLAIYFDAISLYQIEHARLMLTFLRMLAENSEQRLFRIVGEDGATRYMRISEDIMVQEYDVVIGEIPTTAGQKSQTTELLINMADKLSATGGQNIYPLIVEYLPIPQDDKAKLIKAMTPNPEALQAQQQAEAQQQAQQQQMNAVIAEGTKAKAAKDLADAQAKQASIDNVIAQADKTRADTARTLEETGSIAAQTEALRAAPSNEVRVVI
jgi:hypothetical protein